jgi:hypothetical protein
MRETNDRIAGMTRYLVATAAARAEPILVPYP